jgi:hypothetical protein
MGNVTRTVNPLPLDALEPHRFEDLVRQLLYDFRRWRRLEATGRSGADDGFDARGWEVVTSAESEPVDPADDTAEGDSPPASPTEDRLWLIQCKREKRIGPKQIAQYVADIPEAEVKNLHGIVFAAACDFSKRTRDAYRAACAARAIEEWHLWDKAEIEDRLFRPSNDHLLFAYFGFSLRIRKRSLKTQLTSRLATKRRVIKILENYEPVLIRDATDDRYPYLVDGKPEDRRRRGRWAVLKIDGLDHDAVRVVAGRHFAVLKPDNTWDHAERMDDTKLGEFEDPWAEAVGSEDSRLRFEAMAIWEQQQESDRAWYELLGRIPFDDILAIDEAGDETFEHAQIYTTEWDANDGPFRGFYRCIRTISYGTRVLYVDAEETGRIPLFERDKPAT